MRIIFTYTSSPIHIVFGFHRRCAQRKLIGICPKFLTIVSSCLVSSRRWKRTLSADDTAQWTCYVSSVGTRQKCWLFVNPCLPGDRLVGIYLTVSRKYHSKTKNGFKYYWSVNFPRRKLMRSANSAGARAGGPDPRLVSRRSVNLIWRYTISQYVVYRL